MSRRLAMSAGLGLVSVALLLGTTGGVEMWTESQIPAVTTRPSEPVVLPAADSSSLAPAPQENDPPSMLPSELRSDSQAYLTPEKGEEFGSVFIPRLRSRAWDYPLLRGIDDKQLNAGIGHFPHSVMPGQIGNFAIAGHRATHGEPFAFIDQLETGDEVIIRTDSAWFVYSLTKDLIVRPDEVWVVDPVPGEDSVQPQQAILTIVTCEPRWGSASRWIWWGTLTATHAIDDPPASVLLEDQESR